MAQVSPVVNIFERFGNAEPACYGFLGDFFQPHEDALINAFRNGYSFTTGWFWVLRGPQTARIDWDESAAIEAHMEGLIAYDAIALALDKYRRDGESHLIKELQLGAIASGVLREENTLVLKAEVRLSGLAGDRYQSLKQVLGGIGARLNARRSLFEQRVQRWVDKELRLS